MSSGLLNRCVKILSHPLVLCLASFCCCVVLGLLLFLPLNPFTRQFEQLVQQQVPGLELEISKPHLLFPFGVGANQVTLSHPQVLHPPFQLQDLALRPLWLSLLSTNPGVSFDLETFGGQVSGSAYGDGVVQTTLNQLKFEESLEPQLPLTLSGELNGGEFAGQLPFAGKNQSQLQLELNNLKLSGMNKIGSGNDVLDLGRLSCTAEAKGPLVQISNLSVSGPAFDLKGNGNLRVGRTPANSSLNLSLVLTPKPGLDPMLNDLLSLTKKPQADGSYQFSLRGALTRLRFN